MMSRSPAPAAVSCGFRTRWMAAALALAFFALNPNLLYLQTTAMTEPLFVCEMIWVAVWLVEWRASLEPASLDPASLDFDPRRSARLQGWIAAALVAAIFTRYDGWIMALNRIGAGGEELDSPSHHRYETGAILPRFLLHRHRRAVLIAARTVASLSPRPWPQTGRKGR